MIRIAICDDEKSTRNKLKHYLDQFAKEENQAFEILQYESANKLLASYPDGVDLILLDIYMNGIDGMAAAREIRTFDEKVCIIFITTMHQCAIDGYKVRAFGFIKKPVNYAELHHELQCAVHLIERNQKKQSFLAIRSGKTISWIPMAGISYCEIRNHSMLICTDGKMTEYRCSMKSLEEQLLPHGFFRCHASYLVNGSFIRTIEQSQLILSDGNRIPISQRKKKEFMEALAAYIGEQI